MYPQESISPIKVYLPETVKLYRQGESSLVKRYGMHRVLRISGRAMVEMYDLLESEWYTTRQLNTLAEGGWLNGRFLKEKNGEVVYAINSQMHFARDSKSQMIVEEVNGEDFDLQWRVGSKWSATIVWR